MPLAATTPFDATQARRHQEEWARYLSTTIESETKIRMKLVLIPPGEFQMGCPDEYLESTLQWADRVRQASPGTERRHVLCTPRKDHA
jgi:hypothetical protein